MSLYTRCKLCQTGTSLDLSLSQRQIAKTHGVSRSSVQRHLKHVDRTSDSHSEVLGRAGVDPATVKILNGRVSEWQVRTSDGVKTLRSQNITFTPKVDDVGIDLPTLFDQVKKTPKGVSQSVSSPAKTGLVVVWADPQTGKVDRLGGTPELIERIHRKMDKLSQYIEAHPSLSAHFVNLGDSVENIENTSSQLATNDLSLTDQLDLEASLEQMVIEKLALTHGKVTVSVVPSNHCQLRRGKGLIGSPNDDWGIFIVKQLEKAFKLNQSSYGHVSFQYPKDSWTEFMEIDVEGTTIGLTHGHQKTQPNSIPAWWAGQTHGGNLVDSEVLLTGHFHHFIARQTGVHTKTGRDKYHLQAPALDNGSSWFTNISGESSRPGLLVFQVDEHGFNLGSLDIL